MFFLLPIFYMDSIGDVLQAYVSVRDFLEFSNFSIYSHYNSFGKVILEIGFWCAAWRIFFSDY